jgi:cytochrome c oxidase assembly protein subunit 15
MLAHRLAVSTAAATVVLIVFGGLVTNTGAALAVPDWPSTFGHNMFLFPWSGMVGGVFYEHTHRLLGALVGLLTVALAATLWPRGGRLRVLGLVALGVVIAQGVIGGLRVIHWRRRSSRSWPRSPSSPRRPRRVPGSSSTHRCAG